MNDFPEVNFIKPLKQYDTQLGEQLWVQLWGQLWVRLGNQLNER